MLTFLIDRGSLSKTWKCNKNNTKTGYRKWSEPLLKYGIPSFTRRRMFCHKLCRNTKSHLFRPLSALEQFWAYFWIIMHMWTRCYILGCDKWRHLRNRFSKFSEMSENNNYFGIFGLSFRTTENFGRSKPLFSFGPVSTVESRTMSKYRESWKAENFRQMHGLNTDLLK